MTEKLYLNDSYVKEFEAKVVSVNTNGLILDRTAFYPTGGGQPNDTGTLLIAGKVCKVIDVKKISNEVVHILETSHDVKEGEIVKGTIDWKRRYICMRYQCASSD